MVDTGSVNPARVDHQVMSPDDPDVARSIREAAARVEALYAELYQAHPALRNSLAIPGMLVGHGLGVFVASDLTDDQIVAHVLDIVSQIRKALTKIQDAPSA